MLPKKKGWQARAPGRHSQWQRFDPVPAPGHPHRKTSRLPEGAGGCGRVPSELGGEATSGGESPRASPPLPAGLPSPHTELRISRPRTAMALCCLFNPPFVELPTHSQLHEKQRQAETPSLPQEVSSAKLRRVTEAGGSSRGRTGITTQRLFAAQLSGSGHLQA